MDLAGYRARGERFCRDLGRAQYRQFAGHQPPGGPAAVERSYGDLFSGDAVTELRELVARASGPGDRREQALLRFAAEGCLVSCARELEAEAHTREQAIELEIGGRSLALADAARSQAVEPDPARRAAIERARLAAIERTLNPVRAEALEQVQSRARELGWPSYLALHEEVSGIDLAATGEACRVLLDTTAGAYGEALGDVAQAVLGVEVGELGHGDLPRLLAGEPTPDTGEGFNTRRLWSSWRETLAGLGLDPAPPGVRIDLQARRGKSRRAFCAPARVPGEIYVVVSPVGGREDFAALFHEGGHAQHLASVDAELDFEHRHLGDNSVTEAFAFLFEHLIDASWWRSAHLELTGPDRVGSLERLLMLRRYAAKLLFELELHERGAGPTGGARYRTLLSEATGIDWPAELWLADLDPSFYCARYLRAWALEGALVADLRDRFGECWHREQGVGDRFRELWRDGQRVDAAGVAKRLGAGSLDLAMAAGADSRTAPPPPDAIARAASRSRR
ncbi:MAG: M3 family oligoendopeptidase [Actinobacteria bacterium]|nr:MAG: M3 family oligoendopeptidase [Actinomycetota bacterium]